ncbi:unnamed protein product [Leuciscus chuanchicus]
MSTFAFRQKKTTKDSLTNNNKQVMEIHQSAVILLLVLCVSISTHAQPQGYEQFLKQHVFGAMTVQKCDMRAGAEEERTCRMVGMQEQGAWTRWEGTLEKISWTEIWQADPQQINFLVQAQVMEIHQSAVILLLVLCVSFSTHGQPPQIKPRYQKFLNQHKGSDIKEQKCTSEIIKRGITGTGNCCKPVNSFIQAPTNFIKAVCGNGGKLQGSNLFESNQPFTMITCTLRNNLHEDSSNPKIKPDCIHLDFVKVHRNTGQRFTIPDYRLQPQVMEIHQSVVILLLVLCVSFSTHAQPPGYQHFLNQHVGPLVNAAMCTSEIRNRRITAPDGGCKPVNTFIQANAGVINPVCGRGGTPVGGNLFQSNNPFNVVTCRLQSGTPPNCIYRTGQLATLKIVLGPLLVYEVTLSTVETIEKKVSSSMGGWDCHAA